MSRRGNIIIAVLFVLLLSFAGLALLTHTLLHSKIISARRGKWQVAGGLESALLLQMHRYRRLLESSDMNRFAAPEKDFFNTATFPDLCTGVFRVENFFSSQAQPAGSGFLKVRIFNRMTAGSGESRLRYLGRAAVDLLQGDIPLNEVALLVSREISSTQSDYLAGKGVEWPGALIPLVGKPLLAGDSRTLLVDTLQLPGPFPDWRQIREKFKLEPSDAPIAPGIYLALGAGVVEAVFVEGDVQRLEFRAADGLQSIAFGRDGRRSELSYRPGRESLLWSGPEAVGGFRFAEKVIVHGDIESIVQAGKAAFADESRIQVLASGQMRVETGLRGENLELQKARFAHLLLMTSSKDFFGDDERNADIVLAATDGGTLEAHLVAAGSVVHGEGLLKLSGCLIADDIQNSGRLQVDARAGRFDFADRLQLQNFRCLQNFQIQFITENNDE